MCLGHTLSEARVCPFWGAFGIYPLSTLPPVLLPSQPTWGAQLCWVSWLWQRQNQQSFAAFTTAGAQGQTKSRLRQEEAGEMVKNSHLPKSRVTMTESFQLSLLVTLELPKKLQSNEPTCSFVSFFSLSLQKTSHVFIWRHKVFLPWRTLPRAVLVVPDLQ